MNQQTHRQRAQLLATAKRELDAALAELSRVKDEQVQSLSDRVKVAAGKVVGVANSVLTQNSGR